MIVLGARADLFSDVRRCLLTDGRFIDGDDVIHCDGNDAPLTNIYAADLNPIEWEGMDAPKGMPNPRNLATLILECRSPEWVAEIGHVLVQGLGEEIWFVDSADTVWPADWVDPDQLALA